MNNNNLFDEISLAVQKGDRDLVKKLVEQGISLEIHPHDLISYGLVNGMDETGKRWNAGEFFIPQVLVAARAMNCGLDILEPYLSDNNVEPLGVVVIGTVEGDNHDIGKNLVALMLKGKGFKVIDLKTDVSPETFVESIIEHKPHVVAISALLSTTMLNMKNIVDAITIAGLRNQVLIACGGAPVNASFVKEIGADLFAADAVSFAQMVDELRRYG